MRKIHTYLHLIVIYRLLLPRVWSLYNLLIGILFLENKMKTERLPRLEVIGGKATTLSRPSQYRRAESSATYGEDEAEAERQQWVAYGSWNVT